MSAPSDVEALRGQIERHRAELGDTVEALTAKFDVNAVGRYFAEAIRSDMIERAQNTVDRFRRRLRSARGQATELPRRALAGTADGSGAARPPVVDAVTGAAVGAGVALVTYVLARQYISPMWRRRPAAAR